MFVSGWVACGTRAHFIGTCFYKNQNTTATRRKMDSAPLLATARQDRRAICAVAVRASSWARMVRSQLHTELQERVLKHGRSPSPKSGCPSGQCAWVTRGKWWLASLHGWGALYPGSLCLLPRSCCVIAGGVGECSSTPIPVASLPWLGCVEPDRLTLLTTLNKKQS